MHPGALQAALARKKNDRAVGFKDIGWAMAKATYPDLPGRGIHGNTHAPMLNNNSDQIAALVRQWIAEKL
ncbi:MAG: hypothetical protein HQ502_17595 [Alphaproteobacteria bacterium]|nr:hypothetical protein [Alphaproteobacteria bacterium]